MRLISWVQFLDEACFRKYVEQKKNFGIVLPKCCKNAWSKNHKKFKIERKRKVRKQWKDEQHEAKRHKTMEARNLAVLVADMQVSLDIKRDTESNNTDLMDESKTNIFTIPI